MRKSSNNIILFLLIMLTSAAPPLTEREQSSTGTNSYTIIFGDLNHREARIQAEVALNGNELQTAYFPGRFLTDHKSWWELITINSIKDEAGNSLRIVKTSGNNATLDRKVSGKVTLSYTLDFSFIDRNYPNLNTAVGKSFDEGLFVVAKALFIYGNPNLKTSVRVQKPENIRLTVPWSGKDGVYTDTGMHRFSFSNVILSTDGIGVANFKGQKLTYSLATFNLTSASINTMHQIGQDIANYYEEIFPPIKEINYVQLVYGVPGRNAGGEAYPNSSSSAISESSIGKSKTWGLTVYHELFHTWNSYMLKGVAGTADMEWFIEGFTNYYTEKALYKTGHLSESELAGIQNFSHQTVKRAFDRAQGTTSLVSSGKNKGRNFPYIYYGGAVVGKWLDETLDTRTKGEWDLDKLFRHLFQKYRSDGNTSLKLKDLLDEVKVIDPNVSQDLNSMIHSTDWATFSREL